MISGEKMAVTIELSGVQRDTIKTDRIDIPITGKTTVRDALDYLRDKYPALSLDTDSILVAVNNELVPLDRLLMSKDIINILPHIGGG
jgi:molybdopterin converting factor small subunit